MDHIASREELRVLKASIMRGEIEDTCESRVCTALISALYDLDSRWTALENALKGLERDVVQAKAKIEVGGVSTWLQGSMRAVQECQADFTQAQEKVLQLRFLLGSGVSK